jgi:hypothetical protein
MLKNDTIPVLTDLIEKGNKIELSDSILDIDQDPILNAEDLKDLPIDAREFGFDEQPSPDPLNQNRALEQKIRGILDEHMELAWQEIELAIQQIKK